MNKDENNIFNSVNITEKSDIWSSVKRIKDIIAEKQKLNSSIKDFLIFENFKEGHVKNACKLEQVLYHRIVGLDKDSAIINILVTKNIISVELDANDGYGNGHEATRYYFQCHNDESFVKAYNEILEFVDKILYSVDF